MKTTSPDFKIEIADSHRCELGEGPIWDDRTKSIFWLDILKGEIHELPAGSKERKTIRPGQMVGCIAFCENDELIGGLEKGIYFINRETGILREIGNPERDIAGNRFNDGKCDPSGRFWVGTMAFAETEGAGSLYMVDAEMSISKKISDTTISNGLTWSPDKKTMYFIDSPTKGVDAFDYDDSTGNIRNKRRVVSFSDAEGFPDGMTIDIEGMLWIAHWDGWQVSRWNPQTRKKLLSVPLPVARPTCCVFGGGALTDLYISTASNGLSEEDLREQPHAGNLLVIKNIGYQGMQAYRFNHPEKN